MSRSMPWAFSILMTLSMMVRVLRPRRSNLIRPIFSMVFMAYWVTVSPLAPR